MPAGEAKLRSSWIARYRRDKAEFDTRHLVSKLDRSYRFGALRPSRRRCRRGYDEPA